MRDFLKTILPLLEQVLAMFLTVALLVIKQDMLFLTLNVKPCKKDKKKTILKKDFERDFSFQLKSSTTKNRELSLPSPSLGASSSKFGNPMRCT